MSDDSYGLGRRRFLRAAGAGVVGAAGLAAGTGWSRAEQLDEGPDESEYEEILSAAEGDGTAEEPYVLTDVVELQAVRGDVEALYELGNDIDASATEDWNDGAGFEPIAAPGGDEETAELPDGFDGQLNGNGHEITGLAVDRDGESIAALFLINEGTVGDFTLTDASVAGSLAGAVAGVNRGAIGQVAVDGTVEGEQFVGGLVGSNERLITQAEAAVAASAQDRVGAVAGQSTGTITESSATGTVEGEQFVGGAVGQDNGTLETSDADVDVDGTTCVGGFAGGVGERVTGCSAAGAVVGESEVGGFAGENLGELLGSSAAGPVEGEEYVGGLVGTSYGEIRVCSAHGDVSGGSAVGGVLGWARPDTLVSEVYSVGAVEGEDAVGSMVGQMGFEFMSDGQAVELRRGYWNRGAAPGDPAGRIEPGDGDAIVDEESLEGLDEQQFVGEAAAEQMARFDFDAGWRAVADELPIPRAQAASVFEIREVSSRGIEVEQDETFTVELEVENTGDWEGTQTVELVIDGEPVERVEQSLAPGESAQVAFDAVDAAELPVGSLAFAVRSRDDAVEGTLEVESASTATPTPGDDDTPTPGGAADADDDGPGLGVGTAVAGLTTGAYLLSRRLEGEYRRCPHRGGE